MWVEYFWRLGGSVFLAPGKGIRVNKGIKKLTDFGKILPMIFWLSGGGEEGEDIPPLMDIGQV